MWQLYQRVLDLVAPLHDDEEIIQRACHLIILAEIITRWPALQRQLNQSWNERRGLKILATACQNDDDWTAALEVTKLDKKQYRRTIANLRSLLRAYDAIEEVAESSCEGTLSQVSSVAVQVRNAVAIITSRCNIAVYFSWPCVESYRSLVLHR